MKLPCLFRRLRLNGFIHMDLFYDVKVLCELTFNRGKEISLKYLNLFLKHLMNLE